MKKTSKNRSSSQEIIQLRARLAEAEQTLSAIRAGEVDTLVVSGKQGPRVFTLQGAEHGYRTLIESMNEGALTLTAKMTILYANQCFARMVQSPLEQVIGSSLRRFFSVSDRATLRTLLKQAKPSGSKIQVSLNAGDGSRLPVQISIRPLANEGSDKATIGMVMTDMTQAQRNEEILRALSHSLVQTQEAERGRVALELHDHITQLLCAILVRCQTLAEKLPSSDAESKRETLKLREMLGVAAEEVERISRNLRPSVLNELGLVVVIRDASTEFARRTGISPKLTCAHLANRLPADIELALYRILQESLRNIEEHAHAQHVTVDLTRQGKLVKLLIKDDGIGFDPNQPAGKQKPKGGFGLLAMRERAVYVGGNFNIKSDRRSGTVIEVRIPLPSRAKVTEVKL